MERAPRSPTRFVVARHLIGHPDDSPSMLAEHCNLGAAAAGRARTRLIEETALDPGALLTAMVRCREKPAWRSFYFKAQNPAQWADAMQAPTWLSGERAAEELDGISIASDRRIQYVHADDLEAAFAACNRIYAAHSQPNHSNLTIRVADPWLHLDDHVEKGQRWYDYTQSRNLQLAGWRP